MTSGSVRKWELIALAVLLVLIVRCLVGFRVGIGILKGQKGWPTADALRAASYRFGASAARPCVRAV